MVIVVPVAWWGVSCSCVCSTGSQGGQASAEAKARKARPGRRRGPFDALAFAPEVEERLRAFERQRTAAEGDNHRVPLAATAGRAAAPRPGAARCTGAAAGAARRAQPGPRLDARGDSTSVSGACACGCCGATSKPCLNVAHYSLFDRLFALWHMAHLPFVVLLAHQRRRPCGGRACLLMRCRLASFARWLLLLALCRPADARRRRRAWSRRLRPGDLIRGHAKWDDDCTQCHVRFDRRRRTSAAWPAIRTSAPTCAHAAASTGA
jgi:hypothetical protein